MRKTSISLFLLITSTLTGLSDDKKVLTKHESHFHILACSSGVNYPDKGDERIKIDHGGFTYHAKILHPKIFVGPHFSTPFFWVTPQGQHTPRDMIVTMKSQVGVLHWHSLDTGLFFAEKGVTQDKALSGFLLENGYDNMDSGCSGLLFVFTKQKSTAWKWNYTRIPSRDYGKFTIYSTRGLEKQAPETLLKRLAPVLRHAEKRANRWPGP